MHNLASPQTNKLSTNSFTPSPTPRGEGAGLMAIAMRTAPSPRGVGEGVNEFVLNLFVCGEAGLSNLSYTKKQGVAFSFEKNNYLSNLNSKH